MAGYFAAPARKRAVCISISRTLGSALTVYGTAWDEDVGPFEGNVYYSTSGGAVSDLDSSSALNVDNAELRANFDAITTEDLQAGLWNGAVVELFVVNPDDLTMGRYVSFPGTIGQITVDRLTWIGELRGRMQALQQSYGWNVATTCPHTLGDEMCTKDLTAFTVTGTLDSVSTDGLTFTDAARTEAGPAGGVAIASITLGNPTVVTTASALGLTDGAAVNIATNEARLSGPWQARNPTGAQFEINIDSTGYTAFTSGTVTPLSAESGWFAYGKMRIDGGANAGIWREVKLYIVSKWTLQNAFPFAVAGTEAYTMVAGCDKLEETCRVKFSNILNFLGFRVKGNDWLMQVGRSE